jgi:hypothetical protein
VVSDGAAADASATLYALYDGDRPGAPPGSERAERRCRPREVQACTSERCVAPVHFAARWTKANEFDELREWLIQQGFVIVRANGPEPSRTYPSIKFRGNVGEFNQAFHVTVMERSAGFPWCYSVFTDPLMPARFVFRPSKNPKYIEGYSIGPDDSGVGPSC